MSGTVCRLSRGVEHELVENVVIFDSILSEKEFFRSSDVIVSTLRACLESSVHLRAVVYLRLLKENLDSRKRSWCVH